MVDLGEERLISYIKTIGLFRNKAKNVIAMSHKLIDEFGGEVPKTREELVTLPGVGRKTANVVMSMAFGEATIAVDTHIFRIANRTGLAPGKTPDAVEAKLEKIIPPDYLFHAHHWLILHGRYVCKAPQAGLSGLRHRRYLQGGGKNIGDAGPACAAGVNRSSPPVLCGNHAMRIDDEFLGGAAIEIGIAARGVIQAYKFDIDCLGNIHPAKQNGLHQGRDYSA